MPATDVFTERYSDLLNGSYDCVDRIVLNGYVRMLQSGGGFRQWWRSVHGTLDGLDDTHLMRFAGRFARRVWAGAKRQNIPVLQKKRDEEIAETVKELCPADPNFRGVFCIVVQRMPNSVWGVVVYSNGNLHFKRKQPHPYVNHYSFHIQDPDWGHICITVCPHAPFNVQVILNGHEYVARQARQQDVSFTQQGNCFTHSANLAGLERLADTLRSPSAIGPLREVCERWLYSACLCYLFPVVEQQELGLRYDWSVYQLEYSRNLLFTRGREMEEVFQSVIDRTRAALDARTVKTLFGRKHRPAWHRPDKCRKSQVVVETPTYDLTVFKVLFGLLQLKIYTKGEHLLRIEATVHNAKREFRPYGLAQFANIANALRSMVERFCEVLHSVEACWVTDEMMEQLPGPSQVGSSRTAGIDLNRPRMRAVLSALLPLSARYRRFRVEQLAKTVQSALGQQYSSRQASYDLKKLRGKGLVQKLEGTRRYTCPPDSLRIIMAVVTLRERVLKPLLAGMTTRRRGRPSKNQDQIDKHYQALRQRLEMLLTDLGIAA